jgi:alpha-beta hydrolase superfamily lysophospholipase
MGGLISFQYLLGHPDTVVAGALCASALRVPAPLPILQGDADRIVDPTAPSEVASRLTCAHELVVFAGCYHELLHEPPAEHARVLITLDRWFDRQLGG